MVETKQAAIYVRISRDREGAGLGVDRQENDCRDLAARLGWTIVATYTDNDLSAYSGKPRPGYLAMLEDVKAGRVNAILAWHTDRLHRKNAELEEFVPIAEQYGLAIQTVQSGSIDLTTASGRMVARMLGAAAQHEIDHARERMKRAKAQAAASGKYLGGVRPFGYERDGVTVRDREAAILRQASREILAGRSLRAIANELATAGVRTSRGTLMDGVALRRLLLRPRNAGLAEHRGEIVGQAAWPAIIPEEEWRAVVGILTNSDRQKNAVNPGRFRQWLGSGIYVCGICGDRMRVTQARGRRYYTCRAVKHLTRSQEALDEFVRSVIAARLARPDATDLLTVREPDRTGELHTEAMALRQRLRQAEDDYAEGVITGRQLQTATATIEARLADVEAALAALGRANGLGAVLRSADPSAAFLAAETDQQAAVLDALVTVTVLPAPRGRPPGWKPGEPYFAPEYIKIDWRAAP